MGEEEAASAVAESTVATEAADLSPELQAQDEALEGAHAAVSSQVEPLPVAAASAASQSAVVVPEATQMVPESTTPSEEHHKEQTSPAADQAPPVASTEEETPKADFF